MTTKAGTKVTWHGQAARFHSGAFPGIMPHIPFFERVPFSLKGSENEYLDMIVSKQSHHRALCPWPLFPNSMNWCSTVTSSVS